MKRLIINIMQSIKLDGLCVFNLDDSEERKLNNTKAILKVGDGQVLRVNYDFYHYTAGSCIALLKQEISFIYIEVVEQVVCFIKICCGHQTIKTVNIFRFYSMSLCKNNLLCALYIVTHQVVLAVYSLIYLLESVNKARVDETINYSF